MITTSDSFYTYDIGKYYVILPSKHNWSLNEFVSRHNAIKVKENFSYTSNNNLKWETVESLKKLIAINIEKSLE